MNQETIRIGDAVNQSILPDRLADMKLLGSHNGVLFLSSEERKSGDAVVFGYSLRKKEITGLIRLEGERYAYSWTQKGNLLFLGTRYGTLVSIDMDRCREDGRIGCLGNAIDTISVNEHVFFEVNNEGLYRTDKKLSKHLKKDIERVVSALALREGPENRLFAFYFSDGNDPAFDGKPAGGLVEVLDENLNFLSREGVPYAVTQAISTPEGVVFSTRDKSNGWNRVGEGALYVLHSDLSYETIMSFPAAVNSLKQRQEGFFLAGLKNGQVYSVKNGRARVFAQQEREVTGIAFDDEDVYAGSPTGEILRIRN